jgi:hypothetical protein
MPFIEGKLSVEEQDSFLRHIRSCEACMEELEACNVLYMVLRDEDYDNENMIFDDESNLEKLLSLADRRIFGWRLGKTLKYIITTLAAWSIIGSLGLQIYYWILVGFLK